MRYLLSILATLAVASALAAVSLTETEEVTLLRAGTSQGVKPGLDACIAEARRLAELDTRQSGTVQYVCQTARYRIVAKYSPNPPPPPPPPTCPPLPAPETGPPLPCPAGAAGTWTQTRTFTAAPPPTCAIAGEWLPTSPPSGACTTTPPPPPPPTGDTVTNGQVLTITGANFGTKPTAAPVVFDDFEGGALGAKVEGRAAVVGAWGTGEWSFNVTYDSVQPTQGSKVAKHAFGSGTYNASLYVDRNGSTFYLDYWHRVVPRSGTYSRNFKPWRIYGANDGSFANDVVFCDSPGWVGTDWGGGSWIQQPMFSTKPPIPRPINVWEHYRVVVKSGAGGIISQHRNGVADLERATNASGAANGGVRIGHYWGLDGTDDGACPGNVGADVYTDLVYVDTSLARVYLADAPTLAQAKHTAIQIPSAWANTAVTVKANTHGFKPGQTAHVIVIDSANAQRGSKQVTVQ